MAEENVIHKSGRDEKGPYISWRLNKDEEIQLRLCRKCGLAPLFKDDQGTDDGHKVTIMTIYCPKCQDAIVGTPQTNPKEAVLEVVERWNKMQVDG